MTDASSPPSSVDKHPYCDEATYEYGVAHPEVLPVVHQAHESENVDHPYREYYGDSATRKQAPSPRRRQGETQQQDGDGYAEDHVHGQNQRHPNPVDPEPVPEVAQLL